MTPEERAEQALYGVKCNLNKDILVERIASQIREAIWEERNACAKIAAELSDINSIQNIHDELRRSGMDLSKFSMAAWVGITILKQPKP